MKTLKTLALFAGLCSMQPVFAQTDAHLKLSDAYPAAGENITLSYDPTGTVVDGKKDITGVAYFLDNKNYPAADVVLKEDGKLLKGEFTIPENTKAFYVKISSGNQIDNNGDKGYVYLIYKDKQPVAGAYAMHGYMLSSGMGNAFAKIKADVPAGLKLYKKEFTLHPASENEYQTNYEVLIARTPEYKEATAKKIAALEASSDEKDMMLAATLLRATRNTKGADSLTAIIKAKFPAGIAAKNEMLTAVSKEKDPAQKEALYSAYISKYPDIEKAMQDNFKFQIAMAYLGKGDMDNFHKYESQLTDKSNLAMGMNNTAYTWAKTGEHLAEADKLSKQSLAIETEKMNNPTAGMYAPPSQVKRNSKGAYDMFADTYAYVLYKEGKYDEALKYQEPLMTNGMNGAEVNEHYVLILDALGKTDKAKEVAEKSVKDGKSSEAIKDILKKDYIKQKGSEAGYDQYLAALGEQSKNKALADLAKTMIKTPAPAFTLKDVDGKTVSLSDLKGKTVVVDFWATWCGPCKASFPGMQIAVNKYKDDANVKFLFIDTWETDENYLAGVKKFIADNKYSFHVLMDEKGTDGKQSKVVSSFDVSGIPTKFIIDKNGDIRFKYIGYSGSTDKVVDEVVNMIEMTNNPDQANVKASLGK
jgi:peroxiredoxin